MLRFAIPVDKQMQLSDLRIALLNYLESIKRSEALMLRIKESDDERQNEAKDIQEILALFGIGYTQIVYQSEQIKFHRRMAVDLLQKKNAFNCFCTKEELDAKRKASIDAGSDYSYDGTCQNLPPEEVIDNEAPFVVRLRKPDSDVHFSDFVKGEMRYTPDAVDSFVILDNSKKPTAIFASAVDDMLADISVIIQEDSSLDITPKEIAVRHALGYGKAIEYAHIPLMEGADVTVTSLLEEGFLPDAISNYLISISLDVPKDIFILQEATAWFDINKLSSKGVAFDIDALKRINNAHLKRLDNKELSRYVGFADEEIGALAKLYLQKVDTLKALRAKIAPIFAPKTVRKSSMQDAQALREIIKSAPHFETYSDFEAYLRTNSNLDAVALNEVLGELLGVKHEDVELNTLYTYIKNYIKEIIK